MTGSEVCTQIVGISNTGRRWILILMLYNKSKSHDKSGPLTVNGIKADFMFLIVQSDLNERCVGKRALMDTSNGKINTFDLIMRIKSSEWEFLGHLIPIP